MNYSVHMRVFVLRRLVGVVVYARPCGCFGGAWENGCRLAGADHQQDELCHRGRIRAPASFNCRTKYIKRSAVMSRSKKGSFSYEPRERNPALGLCGRRDGSGRVWVEKGEIEGR